MTPQEVFNAMQEGNSVKIINNEYLEQWEIENNIFTVSCIYSDNILTVVNDESDIYSELSCEDIILFF